MPTVLITGANRGIGLEFARQYAVAGWQVFACTRHAENPTLNQLANEHHGKIRVQTLDVSESQQIEELAQQLAGTSIDVLINNAGIYTGGNKENFGTIDYEAWVGALRINTMAPCKWPRHLSIM